MKEDIKTIVANILYLNDTNEITDNASLFKELGMSSIDYVDLCFELKERVNENVTQESLWPFNKMLLDQSLYENSTWTAQGWAKVCEIMQWESQKEQLPLAQLYDYFTVDYIEKRMVSL